MTSTAERCYAVWNSPGSSEYSIDGQFNVKSLGVENDGILGQRHVPEECYCKISSLLLYLCLSERVRKRDLQVAAGRILRFVLRNKCTAVSLDQVWTAIAR